MYQLDLKLDELMRDIAPDVTAYYAGVVAVVVEEIRFSWDQV